ncbi:hypothetical protein ACWGDT_24375 [Streptomyces avermitilis]
MGASHGESEGACAGNGSGTAASDYGTTVDHANPLIRSKGGRWLSEINARGCLKFHQVRERGILFVTKSLLSDLVTGE